jgi:hypothetical protein
MPPVPSPELVDEVISGEKTVEEFLDANRDLKPESVKTTAAARKKSKKRTYGGSSKA